MTDLEDASVEGASMHRSAASQQLAGGRNSQAERLDKALGETTRRGWQREQATCCKRSRPTGRVQASGSTGEPAIVTNRVKASQIIRNVLLRRIAIVNDINPF